MLTIRKLQVLLYLLVSTIWSLHSQLKNDTIQFISPVDIPIFLSGNFGEIRGTHFHTGIDIKTQGVQGKNILAIADGYVSRIKVSAGSYGYALYITHPQGYVSVYGHLQRFNKSIMEYVLDYQYKNKRFTANIFPPKNKFKIIQGDLIGLSGNTGSSQGPHLHFEIRNSTNEHPLNPLLFNFDINDNIKPRIYSITVYPLDFKSHVKMGTNKVNLKTIRQNGTYKLADNNIVKVYGEIGLGIECNDFLNGSNNKCGVYSIELRLDSNLIYSTELDELDFAEQGYVKSHIDYETKITNKRTIQKSYIDLNNKASIYTQEINRGVIGIYDTLEHTVNYTLKDVYNNESNLEFKLKGVVPLETDSIYEYHGYSKAMPYQIENIFEEEGIKITIPVNSLYHDLFFTFSSSQPDYGSYSKIYNIHNNKVPLHKSIELQIESDSIPDTLMNKAVIANINNERASINLSSYGGSWKGNVMHTRTKEFGTYGIFVDTIMPEIIPVNIYKGKDMTAFDRISIKIKDDFAGISKYEGFIDDEWVLFKYDAKKDLIFYNFSDKKILPNKNHNLVIRVYDNVQNMTEIELPFYY